MAKERLQKLLAQANVASRRASEDLISKGRVRVNGDIAKVGDQADPETDTITVDGTRLDFSNQKRIYIALNKPKNVLSTDKPHRTDKRQTVADLLHSDEHLFSVGRLDADSEGLLVMTNDGDLAFRLTHPRYRHTKTYRVEVVGLPTAETLEAWQQGVFLDDGKTAPCIVEIVKGSVKGSVLRIIMTEGKKRQIRRVAASLGHQVTKLTRTHIGTFALGDLASGQWREMTPKEVIALKTPAPELRSLRAQPRPKTRSIRPAKPSEDDASDGDSRTSNDRKRPSSGRSSRSPKKPYPRRGESKAERLANRDNATSETDTRGERPSDERPERPTKPGKYRGGKPTSKSGGKSSRDTGKRPNNRSRNPKGNRKDSPR